MRGKRDEIILWTVVFAAGVVLMAASAACSVIFWQSRWTLVMFFVVLGTVSLAMPVFLVARTLRLRRVYLASDGRICPQCGHSLLGLGEEGICPECGKEFERSDVRLQWKDIIGVKGSQLPETAQTHAQNAASPSPKQSQ